jgi:bcr-type benzoyl-CoA reductase subunit C
MDHLEPFRRAAADPGALGSQMKMDGRAVIGYPCSYAPEELITAAGFQPFRLFGGGRGEYPKADAHLQAYCCGLVKGMLEDALAGRLDFLTGAVFPHTCDTIQRLSDIWRINVKPTFFADVVLPVKLDTQSSRDYMADVLARFRDEIGVFAGLPVSDDALAQSLALYNHLRSGLAEVYRLRSENPGLIHSRDVHALVKGAMVMDRTEAAEGIDKVIDAMRAGEYQWPAQDRKRLLLVGGFCDHPDMYDGIENAGGVVVYDDLCMGSRWFEGLFDADRSPMEALTDRLMSRPICAAKHLSNTSRGERIVELAREHKADGVVVLLIKFCDPHAFDYPYLKDHLDQARIPNLLYEIEDAPAGEGQLATRLETFVQMIEGR